MPRLRSRVRDSFPAPGFTRESDRAFPRLFSSRGGVAEWSCSGLQSRVRRFDSDPRLQDCSSSNLPFNVQLCGSVDPVSPDQSRRSPVPSAQRLARFLPDGSALRDEARASDFGELPRAPSSTARFRIATSTSFATLAGIGTGRAASGRRP